MATILCIWELGGGLGHISNLARCASALEQEGHSVTVVLQDLHRAQDFFHNPNIRYLQSPLPVRRPKGAPKAFNQAEILINRGYGNVDILASLIKAWQNLYRLINPDTIIFDYAPTAQLAARGFAAKTIALANACLTPVDGMLQPDMRKALYHCDERTKNSEALVVDSINQANQKLGLSPIHYLADLYKADHLLITGLPELDPYRQQRSDAVLYNGAVIADDHHPIIRWNHHSGKKVFFLYQT